MNCCSQTRCWAVLLPLLMCLAGDAVAESGWPPFAEEIRQKFAAHRHRLESVEDRMHRESYTELDVFGTWEVTGSRIVDGELQFEKPEDHDPWLDDLFPLRIDNVKQTDVGYRFSRAKPMIEDDTAFEAIYFHGSMTGLLSCSTSFANVDCGYCGDNSADGWITVFYWTPRELSIRNVDIPDDTELEDAMANFNEELSVCMSKGLAEMASLADSASEESD